MTMFISIIFLVYGLILGSFYNVVGLRVPTGNLLKEKYSYCYTCKRTLSWVELIPVFSFLIQRGKCKGCGDKISILYPIIELLSGVLFATAYLLFGWSIMTFYSLVVISMVLIITVSDIRYQIIPNKVLLFFLPIVLLFSFLTPLSSILSSVLGAILAFGLLLVILIVSGGGMGMGDLKYFTIFGFTFGWKLFLLLFLLSTLYGAIVNGLLLVTNRVTRKTKVPFGPYIGAAAITILFFGNQILDAYLSLFGF